MRANSSWGEMRTPSSPRLWQLRAPGIISGLRVLTRMRPRSSCRLLKPKGSHTPNRSEGPGSEATRAESLRCVFDFIAGFFGSVANCFGAVFCFIHCLFGSFVDFCTGFFHRAFFAADTRKQRRREQSAKNQDFCVFHECSKLLRHEQLALNGQIATNNRNSF
jgi:hypothetical protein